jgi:hypothetical protein
VEHLATATLERGLDHVRCSPTDVGQVELIVRRPAEDEREVLTEATLDLVEGLVGDTWRQRGSGSTPDGAADPDAQLTVMNARAAALFAGRPDRRQLSGDQLFIDLDLSQGNVPAGTRLQLGSAVIELTAKPHTGCKKFMARFGRDALALTGTPVGRQLRLRGANARVVVPGTVRAGDTVRKLPGAPGGSAPVSHDLR